MKSVSYIIAGYNEGKIIESTIQKAIQILSQQELDFELILVDDASKDNTAEVMKKAEENYPNRVRFLQNSVNINFGASILRGLQEATKEYIMYNAADLPLCLNDTKAILEDIGDSDLLVLERISYDTTIKRKILSKINIILLHVLFPRLIKGTPILNFTQVFKKDIINQITPIARSPIFIWPEMIFRAKKLGLKVANRKTKLSEDYNRGQGSFGKPKDIIWGLKDMMRFRLLSWVNKV